MADGRSRGCSALHQQPARAGQTGDLASVGPYVDSRVTAGARSVGLPSDREYLTGLLTGTRHPASLAAALVRVSLSRRLAAEVAAGSGS
jgi:hypothetical protein